MLPERICQRGTHLTANGRLGMVLEGGNPETVKPTSPTTWRLGVCVCVREKIVQKWGRIDFFLEVGESLSIYPFIEF